MADRKPHKREKTPTPREASTPSFLNTSAQRRAPKAARRERPARAPRQHPIVRLKTVAIVLAVLVALAIAGVLSYVVLSNTSAFPIHSIESPGSEHVSAEDVARLASVPEGTTMLNYDEALIIENLMRNPWIAEVRVRRSYPDKLLIEIEERDVRALVMMNAGQVIWCLGDDNVWIEPVKVQVAEGQSTTEAALARANEMGALLVTDVPQSVEPVAGAPADDEVFSALAAYRKELSQEFWANIVHFSAPSAESISCVLSNGVEVSLGAATNIATKESIVNELLEQYPNKLTYINVRVPTNPSYRMVGTDSVQEGSGALGDVATPADTVAPDADASADQADGGDAAGADAEAEPQVDAEGLD